MSVTSEATTVWKGSLFDGSGDVTLVSSDQGPFDVNWKARSEGSTSVTTPEELIAAAHSSCFSMAFSLALAENGTPPDVDRDDGIRHVHARQGHHRQPPQRQRRRPRPQPRGLRAHRRRARRPDCPVSQALAGVEITIEATLA